MAAPIAPISIPRAIEPIAMPALPGSAAAPSTGFHQVLASALSQVSQSDAVAGNAVSNYLAGGNQELHSTILATQNASLNLELLLQVRNKVVAAYDEIMKMQI
jgi:flagellar hook-basal body complex protein FliE